MLLARRVLTSPGRGNLRNMRMVGRGVVIKVGWRKCEGCGGKLFRSNEIKGELCLLQGGLIQGFVVVRSVFSLLSKE